MIFSVAFEEAIRWAEARDVALPDVFYGDLQPETRGRAFTITGLARLDQISRILGSLSRATADGQTFSEWKQEILTETELFQLPQGRLETIFRNALQTNYMAGYWQQIQETKEDAPFVMYDAINDSRTRPTHAAMDGFIAHADDQIWNRWTPPVGHNCRCGIIQLSKEAAERLGYSAEPPPDVQPDEGWSGNPANDYDQTLHEVVERARDRAIAVSAALPPSFYGAVSTMLDALDDALTDPGWAA